MGTKRFWFGVATFVAAAGFAVNGYALDPGWARLHNGDGSAVGGAAYVTIDAQGYIYVAASVGDATQQSDFLLVKYTPDGSLLWERRWDGPATGQDHVSGLALDAAGSVYLTGTCDIAGAESSGPGTGAYAVLKYDPAGDLLWEQRYAASETLTHWAYGSAVAPDGRVWITGVTGTVCYDADGDFAWAQPSAGRAVTVDDAGQAWVLGLTADPVVLVYDRDGNIIWDAAPDPTVLAGPRAHCVDADGGLYIAGYAVGDSQSGNRDFAVVKYDADGVLLWARHEEGLPGGRDEAQAVQVDASGNVYVTGTSFDESNWWRMDQVTLKYDPAGSLLWTRSFNGPADGYDCALGLDLDARGNAYVTGFSWNGATGIDFATVKYNAAGDLVWSALYDASGTDAADMPSFDRASAVCLTPTGDVCVAGLRERGGTAFDLVTVMYDQCACECHGDPVCDGVLSVLDVVATVNAAFRDGNVVADPNDTCPHNSTDIDCSGYTNVLDVVRVVNAAFRNADPAASFCRPCAP
ncbi:MAG TPA: hypothetical protein VM118_05835 [Acidobacteriota bacterium]|nr:hypothetical protein [Acidobacteriota bacterium]